MYRDDLNHTLFLQRVLRNSASIMQRKNYSVHGKKHHVEVLKSVMAVISQAGTISGSQSSLPKSVRSVQSQFLRGGVVFVRNSKSAANIGCNVCRCCDSGRLLVATRRISVQFKQSTSKAKIREAINSLSLAVCYKFRHRKNCFDIRVPIGSDVFEVARCLTSQYKCDYATPVFLEEFEQRVTTPTDPKISKQWFLDRVGATNAWESATGKGTRVAIIDWGFHIKNKDLKDKIARSGSFIENGADLSATFFEEGQRIPRDPHGTAAAGMAVAQGNNDKFGCGLAYEADWIPIAALSRGIGTQQSLARAIMYAVDQRTEKPGSLESLGADVISISIFPGRHSVIDGPLSDALEFALNKGRHGLGTPIFYAVKNGNSRIHNDAIASDSRTIAVGASNKFDKRSSSAFGSALDLLAPGKSVYTLRSERGMRTVSGTSFATPLAAAAAALIIDVNPNIEYYELLNILRGSCEKVHEGSGVTYDVSGHNEKYGFGRLNAAEAVKRAKNS